MTSGPRAVPTLLALALLLSACASSTPSVSPPAGEPGGETPAATNAGAGGGQTPFGSQASVGPGDTQPPNATTNPERTAQPGGPTPTDGQASSPTPTPAGGQAQPLPACAYKDKPATGNPDTDWATMVLDTIYRLPSDFVPRKLVSTSKAGLQSGFEVIPAVIDDLRDMHEASLADDAEIAIRWAYRSYADQQGAFSYWVRHSGEAAALQKSARPGHSEHQLGTAIDFRSADSLEAPWDYDDWATTEAGAWMGQNAWRFGFILSYPKNMQATTCYAYEPWHYRYVGRDLAKEVHQSGETLREFLWERAHTGG